MLDVDVAELAGIIAEGVLYGIFVVLFAVTMYLTGTRRGGLKANKITVTVAIIMAILATLQLVADTTNIFLAFINRNRAERIAFLADVTQQIFILKHVTLILMFLVSDLFVTYRCWLVWNKNVWIILLPLFLSLGSGASGFYAIWTFQHFNPQALTRAAEERWLIAISTLSLGANVIATSLSAFRIWHSSRRNATILGTMSYNVMPIVMVVIESGALNAAYMVANTITWVTGDEGLTVEMGTSLIGCIFMLVIIRVCVNSGQGTSLGSQKSASFALRSLPRPARMEMGGDHSHLTDPGTGGTRIIMDEQVFSSRADGSKTSPSEDSKPWAGIEYVL